MTNYDQVRGYLHSHGLRWSYGGMQGRSADWTEDLADKPASLVVPAVAASGFDGIWVDRYGYPAGGASISAALRTVTGVAPVRRPHGGREVFDTAPSAPAPRRRHALRPAVLTATRRSRLPARVTVRYPTGVQQQLLVTPRGVALRRLLSLRLGTSTIRLTAAPVDPRTSPAQLELRAQDVALVERGFVPFL